MITCKDILYYYDDVSKKHDAERKIESRTHNDEKWLTFRDDEWLRIREADEWIINAESKLIVTGGPSKNLNGLTTFTLTPEPVSSCCFCLARGRWGQEAC